MEKELTQDEVVELLIKAKGNCDGICKPGLNCPWYDNCEVASNSKNLKRCNEYMSKKILNYNEFVNGLPKENKITDEQIKRMLVLLKATSNILSQCDKSNYVLNVLEVTTKYDEAECDGYCLMNDIDYLLEEIGE